ncbi:ThiF family adenylyltransferase [Kibdelosporangium persicum]|uniref:Dinucleotide-utilizing enzyme n=1 Tax=Kibdelosporangium persicum TaxID=2698649 RepID=A0ABX2F2I7_9PSEU|nr:ThiF family adenylyltransferase [Kibdelosporangium persicum]NRN65147.1 dinucleotide-utilizing enzyme [Kibdelosporangium persicum]
MTGLAALEDVLAGESPSWQPVIVTCDDDALRALCRDRGIAVLDTLDQQLAELARVRSPGAGRDSPARWVYFPWERRVVHLLAENDFFDVITDRNQDKISRAEQDVLRGRTVGVIGLSVGGEAAVTVAQEHLCGHIKLADFDRLDLSNLNRLNAGVDDLGVPKAWIVARRIAKIDPYMRVTVFDEGVTPANVDAFLDGVDLLVEECDDLALKYGIRVRAKARGLDVVYAADERGFLSIEPYRTHPDLPVFHGLVNGPQELTDWLGELSDRSRRSVPLIGQSLCGYPQLAGEARWAAGQVGHVARRLLLGEALPPFHGHLDPAEWISGPSEAI